MSLEHTIRSMFIKEHVEPIAEDGHVDVASAKRQCKTIIEDAQAIMSALNSMPNDGSLPTWWTNKLAVASNSMNKMNDYISNPTEMKEEVDKDKLLSAIKKKLSDEGGAAGFEPLKDVAKKMGVDLTPEMLKGMDDIEQHRDGDYILDVDDDDDDEEEMDEMKVRGKEVYDKTFANKTQADNYAKKMGGRVQQVGRVFYVFKEELEEAVNMAKVRSTYNDIMKGGRQGPPDDDEVGDYIGKGMTKADIKALIDMLAKQGYDKKFLTKDLAPLAEAKRDPSKSGGTGYDLYHKDFSSAMKHAYDYAKKKLGVDIDPKEIDDKVASGPRKPSKGKTNTYRLMGKDGKKGVQIQVANLDDKKFELNMYKESVELDEAKSKEQQIADLEKMLDRISGNTASVRMKKFALQKKIDKLKNEEVELDEAYKTPAEAKAYEDGKKAARSGKKYDDNPNKKGSKEYTAWSKGHNEARAKGMKEDIELDEKKGEPPFDVSKGDYSGAAKELTQYAKTKGGMDKDDFLSFANRMREIAKRKSPQVLSRFARDLESLDTSPREKIISVMRDNGIKVSMKGNKMMIEGFGAELTATQRLRSLIDTKVPVSESEQSLSVGQSIMEKAIARVREAEGEKMTDAQLKRREEIAKDLPDDEFKDRYGDKWMQVKMATATKMAKGEK